jgi:hypothetical protein
MDTVLVEKKVQFKLPPSAFQRVMRRALRRSVLLGRAVTFSPEGRRGMEVSSQRVSSTHAWRGRLSRLQAGGFRVTTSSLVLGLAATVLILTGAN